jgi:hypothetical protein
MPERRAPSRRHADQGMLATRARRNQRANAGDGLEATAQLIGAVPSKDAPVNLEDLPLDQHELRPQSLQTFPCHWRYPPISPFVDKPQQPLRAVAANAGDNAKLGHVNPGWH